jgi:hypothetical protein
LFLVSLWSSRAYAAWPSGGTPLCKLAGAQYQPLAVGDGAGGAIACWYDERDEENTRIYAQRVTGTGAIAAGWTANGVSVCSDSSLRQDMAMIADGAGGVIVAWSDFRNVNDLDIYVQRITGTGAVATGWPVNGFKICGAAKDQETPVLCTDGAGGAIVAWIDYRDNADYKVYATHVTSAGGIATGWPVNGLRLATTAKAQYDPKVTADGAGGAIVAWSDERNGIDADIYAQRVSGAGAVVSGWPVNGFKACGASGEQYQPAISSIGASGAYLAWTDDRNGSPDVYAIRLTAAGAVAAGWTANGVAVCAAALEQNSPIAVTMPDSGLVIGWNDLRSGSNYDIYAQRRTLGGAIASGWVANGVSVVTAPADQTDPSIVPDAAGGLYVTWNDSRKVVDDDVYSLRMLSNSRVAPGWKTNGIGVCTLAGDQQYPVMVSDGAGGAIVVWNDFRDDPDGDIYAQRQAVGATLDVATTLHADFALDGPSPNPTFGRFSVSFTLPTTEPATLEVLDVAGRRVESRAIEALGPGRHTMRVDGSRPFAPGMYLVRLSQGPRVAGAKVCVVK